MLTNPAKTITVGKKRYHLVGNNEKISVKAYHSIDRQNYNPIKNIATVGKTPQEINDLDPSGPQRAFYNPED